MNTVINSERLPGQPVREEGAAAPWRAPRRQPLPLMPARLKRVGVFRALMLGDLLCAVPALRALAAACPQARITLIGLPWARELAERLPMVDDFIAFPGHPELPEMPPQPEAWEPFMQAVRERDFELLLQLHGSGEVVNPMLRGWAQRHAGFYPATCRRLPLHHGLDSSLAVPWPQEGHEIERLLRLTDHLGLPRQGEMLEFPLHGTDRTAARALLDQAWAEQHPGRAPQGRHVIVHAGSQLPSRRWLPERFAAVADRAARAGHTVLLTGTAGEAEVVGAVRRAMREPALDLTGRTSLWTLGALVESADLVVCNDTGISHIAAALRRPSVVVSSGADTTRWSPLDGRLHRVHAQSLPCRPCSHVSCPTGHLCARAIGVEEVAAAVEGRLAARAGEPPARMRLPGGAW